MEKRDAVRGNINQNSTQRDRERQHVAARAVRLSSLVGAWYDQQALVSA